MKKKTLKLFEYDQNNSGGTFIENDKLCHKVVIEAYDANEANEIAQTLGIYFNGCDDETDCPCCGDRWYQAYADSYLKFPMKWDQDQVFKDEKEYLQHCADQWGWTVPDVRVYYKKKKTLEIFSKKQDEPLSITQRTS
jgi:hypothetical protein